MRKLLYLFATSILLFFLTQSIALATIYYVDLIVKGTGDGLSWVNAFNHPQDAMDAAQPGDQIWVADGTYTRKSPTDTAVLTMKDGVDIYGGFAGWETDLSQRDYENNVTILDALGTDQSHSRVVIGADNARLDGFTITGGHISFSECGGGMANYGVSPTIENCIFTNNIGWSMGGGICNLYDSSPTLTNCTFSNNFAGLEGGAIYEDYGDNYCNITNCTFTHNEANESGGGAIRGRNYNITNCSFTNNLGYGSGALSISGNNSITNCTFKDNFGVLNYVGALGIWGGSSTITNCVFSGNHIGPEGEAGAIRIYNSDVSIKNSLFSGNWVGGGGAGAIYSSNSSSSTIINSTFNGNRAFTSGTGGINSDPDSTVTIINSILWGNIQWDQTSQSYGVSEISGPATVIYSNIQGGYTGIGNINADPRFVKSGQWDDNGTPDTFEDDIWTKGDYHLQSSSPSVNFGTDTNAPNEDIEGTSRPQGLGYDMGAYETVFTCTDSDSDGFYAEGGGCGPTDCDDTKASINPDATEVCNNTDDNCDGQIDEGLRSTYYLDNDLDGYGDINNPTQACTTPDGYVTNNTDCDDSDTSVNPAGTEVCSDLKDNDCDGSQDCVDSECSGDIACVDCTDGDGDSYSLEGGVCGPVDCDDTNSAINPGATETCNELDDNCNGSVDEGATTTFYLDSDSDGFGDMNNPTQACSTPSGYVANNSDCDDTDALISPAADEICSDTIDNDCDGLSDCSDSNCLGDPVCSSDGDGTGSGGCSIIGVKMSIEDALAGYGLLIVAIVWLGISRRKRFKK